MECQNYKMTWFILTSSIKQTTTTRIYGNDEKQFTRYMSRDLKRTDYYFVMCHM